MFRTKKGTRGGKRKRGGDKSRKRREKIKRGKQLWQRAVERRNNCTIKIIAWNMCKMSARAEQRENEKSSHIQKRGWEVVLMTEITSLEEEGVIWMGEASNLTVIIHSKHSAILLRRRALNEWLEGGQKK